ncbi:cilia- and flagella-associated protein 65 [Tenrec ecaudatus]|uniref:cilia- and flagella-associated protein 65 n=1 Tax=Tenrec ecaudatus TaxID=94439 RepID=UPI003F5A75AF
MTSTSCLSACTMTTTTVNNNSMVLSSSRSSSSSNSKNSTTNNRRNSSSCCNLCVRSPPGRLQPGNGLKPSPKSQRVQKCLPAKQDRVRRMVVWGIEVVEELQWKGWELGKEMTRNLALKNLSLKIQKINYRPPKTKFFYTVIPQPILLSPGITFHLPIFFRPLEEKEYMDQLWFEKADDRFCVDLRAILPCHKLICPEFLKLPMCAVGGTVEAWFCLDNVGDLPTFFNWEVSNPFQIQPTTGLLEPGQTCQAKVTFHPLKTATHEMLAVCWFGDKGEQKTGIQLEAVAKCAQLVVTLKQKRPEDQDTEGCQKVLHFGSVPVGCTAERQIKLFNPSMVSAPFRIEVIPDMLIKDQAFSCHIMHGIVPPGEKKCVSLFFHPKTLDGRNVEYVSIVPAGCASHILLKVVGCCIGPAVALKHGYVNFSYVALGSSAEKFLWLENQADCPAYFQFDIDCRESVFNIRPAFGTLAGKARLALRCIFRPTHPIIYFRRVACLIHHQDPMFLDLLGTCHSDSIKPAILHPQHLTWYRTHLVRGLTLYPPDILGAMLREDKLEQDENGALMIPNEDLEDKPPPEYPDIPPMMEYLYDGTGDTTIFPPPVSIEPVEVDFGSCPGPEAPTPVSLCLMNHTKGKVTVVWTRRPDCPFWVSPVTCDVPPLKSTALRLHFQPPYPNCLCKAELEVFAVYKVLRSYNNIEEECTVCPSWCLTLPVQGHSYSEASEHHIPQYSLDAPKLFPAVPAGEPSCRSLLLVNKGSMLLTFNLESKRSPDIMLRPTSGLVAPGGHQIILVCTYPKGNFWTEHIFHMLFNACSQYLQEVHMQSREEPLQLDTCKNIFFKPTSVGCSSTSPLTLHNPTRLPLEFEWRVSEEHCKILAVQPTRGLIQANETITLMWIFSPLEDFKYLFRVGMWVWEAGLPPNTKPTTTTHYLLQLVGMGVTTSLSTQEQELDFGNILVNSRSCRELVLLNQSKCTLHYRLSLEQRSPELAAHQPPALHLERTEGTLPPRSQDSVGLIACPTCRAQYAWTIRYSLLSPRDKKAGKRQELCRVTLMAVYPLLSVLDVCTMGSAEGITRKHLWSLFSLNTFNSYLERDPTPLELTYKVPVRHSMSQIPPIFTPLKLDFNFGAAPLEAPPSVVLLALKNCGLVPLDWAFLFPNDQQIDLELWADQAEFSDTELHQMRALDNCLFSICPKACSLSPGQVQVVELRYNHLFIGTDRLPVLFKVSHGREILLSFIGVTVELGQKYVHFTSTSHQFVPVSIGDTLPPRQIYELYNGGSVPVTYEIQTHILSQIQEQNFDHPIFCCLNPQGEIQPGTTTPVLWIFSPIEAKTYTVDVPIHILGWNSALIRFHGVGYDPHVMGATAPFHNISSLENGSTHFRLTVPGQMILLSQSSISLGNVPVQSKCSRLLFLNNMSKKETIVFAWELEPLDFGEVSVSPSVGVIPPEESVPFVVTLKTSVHASFYSVDLVCKVYRQQLLRQHHKELQEWKEEKGRQAVEFTITDRKVERRVYCTACAPARKYKTLPPIKIQQPFTRPASWHLRIPREESSWPCPEPPVPGMLRLSLTARTHAIDSFLANFFSEFPCHFLHRELLTKKPPGEEFTEDNWVSVSKQEKVLLIDCLTIIIRGLLEDKNFHEAVDQCLVEQVPYFCQFWSEQSAKFMAKKSSLHLVPFLSLPPETWEEQKGKEPEDFKLRLRRKDLREAEERQEEEEEEQEEEEEEEEQEEEEEEVQEEEELAREELVEEQLEVKEEEEKPWIGMEPSLHPGSQESLQRLWQQQLKAIMKEEQEQDEKEAVSRLPAFTNLQEVLLENIIQNILVEASRGEVVLTSRPRVIALPPFGVTRATTPDPLPRTPSAAQRQQAEDTRQARRPTTLAPPPPPLPSPFQ